MIFIRMSSVLFGNDEVTLHYIILGFLKPSGLHGDLSENKALSQKKS
jgi:hypothetical protein